MRTNMTDISPKAYARYAINRETREHVDVAEVQEPALTWNYPHELWNVVSAGPDGYICRSCMEELVDYLHQNPVNLHTGITA